MYKKEKLKSVLKLKNIKILDLKKRKELINTLQEK